MEASPSTELSLAVPSMSSSIGTAQPSWQSISLDAVACFEGGGSRRANTSSGTPHISQCAWFYPLLHQMAESRSSCYQAPGDKRVDFVDDRHGFSYGPQAGSSLERASLRPGVLSVETETTGEEKNTGINLEEMPKGFDEHDEGVTLTHSDGAVNHYPNVKGEQHIGDTMTDHFGTITDESPVSSIAAAKNSVDPSTAAAARRRRKELTKLKYFHGRQISLHG